MFNSLFSYRLSLTGHDLQVLLVKLEQILHLKVDCSDFGPVRDKGSLPYLLRRLLLESKIS